MKVINYIIAATCLLGISSCIEDNKTIFSLTGETINGYTPEKAYLYSFMEEYQKSMLIDSANINGGKFSFNGRCEDASEAFVKFSDGRTVSFILSPARLHLTVGLNAYTIKGTKQNNALSLLIMQQHKAVNRRAELQAAYDKMQADSTLTKTKEDSVVALYRSTYSDFRKSITKAMADTTSPLLAKEATRLFSQYLPAE